MNQSNDRKNASQTDNDNTMNPRLSTATRIPFSPPAIGEEEIEAVCQTLQSGWITTGPRVAEFEGMFEAWKKEKAVAVNSCTAALHVSLLAADIKAGDQVITTPLTFPATINAILHSGAQPVLADIDPVTMNIDPDKIEGKINPRVKAIIVVHFAGQICQMQKILKLCKTYRLILIEDCAHAIEARQDGRESGTFGDFACFSFYATKNLTTGEGGLVLSKDAKQSKKIRALANHGRMQNSWETEKLARISYDIGYAGFKYNMTDIQAALGIVQLRALEKRYHRRREIWQLYLEQLKDCPIQLPQIAMRMLGGATEEKNRHALHLFIIHIEKKNCGFTRDQVAQRLLAAGIGVGIHYQSIVNFPFYQNALKIKHPPKEEYANAHAISASTLSLPFSPILTNDQISQVCSVLKKILHEKSN